ncbi:MAG: TetR/AcrR family transcriptional regulator [Thermoleophilia bacterium]
MAGARLSRSERSAHTRRELLEAAERRFFVHGYHGTTLDDIADEAGYTKGAVYSTFKSKAGLFLALFDEVMDRRLVELRELLEPHDDDESRFRALAGRPVDDRNAQFLLLAIEFWTHAAREPAILEEFAARYRRFRADLAALGPQDSALGSDRWAIVTLALANGLALERLIDPAGVPGDLMAAVQSQIARS